MPYGEKQQHYLENILKSNVRSLKKRGNVFVTTQALLGFFAAGRD